MSAISSAMAIEYAEHGWIVVEGVFDTARMDAVAALASECCRREAAGEIVRRGGLPTPPQDPELSRKIKASLSDRGPDGQLLPRKLDAPITKDRGFGAVAADPDLRMLAVSPATGTLSCAMQSLSLGDATCTYLFLDP